MQLKGTKICIMGIQGSGKTELAKYFMSKFENPVWHLVHLDDIERMPDRVKIIKAEEKSMSELDRICRIAIEDAKKRKIDCLVIDEADMFINRFKPLTPSLNDLVINHRHYGISVIFITRRPQDIPAKIVESCEHLFIFALPNSTNVDRKLNAIDRNLLSMMPYISKESHDFIYKGLGKNPKIYKAIKRAIIQNKTIRNVINSSTYISNYNENKLEE